MSVAIILTLSFFGLAVAFYYSRSVNRVAVDMGVEDADTRGKLRKIHAAIAEGAMAFLKQEYKFMAIFMVLFAIVIALLIDDKHTTNVNEGIYTAVAFIFGAIISIASGYIGMKIATAGNVRTTVSANQSLSGAFNVALHSGAVMGFALVSLASLGLLLIYLGLKFVMPDDVTPHVLMEVIAGFGLGGSSIALFARVGGGIFTKAADVGADLVGKVRREFRKTIRVTRPLSLTTLATTSVTLPVWALTSSAPVRRAPAPLWSSARLPSAATSMRFCIRSPSRQSAFRSA